MHIAGFLVFVVPAAEHSKQISTWSLGADIDELFGTELVALKSFVETSGQCVPMSDKLVSPYIAWCASVQRV